MSDRKYHDAAFIKYAVGGAYHWREVGGHWIRHHAFTAERYRRTLGAAGLLEGKRVVDYGCGDGALLGWIARRVGPRGRAIGFDPNREGLDLARGMFAKHRLEADFRSDAATIADGSVDVVICAEVIEHVVDVPALMNGIARMLRPGGRAVITTPIRLTETPEDPNHVREWFPGEFLALMQSGPLRLVDHQPIIPAAAPEIYYWRPGIFLRVPVFRLLCNLLSIYFGVNALSWLRARPRLYMMQIATLDKIA